MPPIRYIFDDSCAMAVRVLMGDELTKGCFLNLGAGTDIRKNFCNLDIIKLPGIGTVCDFTQGLPFANETFDGIIAYHVLEHIPHKITAESKKDAFIFVMEELHRVLRPGGWLIVRIPEGHSRFGDPTHYRQLSKDTFLFFTNNHKRNYLTSVRFVVKHKFSRYEPYFFAYHLRKYFGIKRAPRILGRAFESEIFLIKTREGISDGRNRG